MDSSNPTPKGRAASPTVKYWFLASVVLAPLVILSFAMGVTCRLQMAQGNTGVKNITRILSYRGLSAYHSEGSVVDINGGSDEDIRPLQTMLDTLRQVRQLFVERIESTHEKDMAYGAIAKMLESLGDPESRFLLPEQRQVADDALQGKFHGIGAVLGIRKEKTANGLEARLVVIASPPGSPAAQAGLLPGDSIRYLDAKWLICYDLDTPLAAMVKKVRNAQLGQSAFQKALDATKKKIDNGITIQKAADILTSKDTGTMTLSVVRRGESQPRKVTLTPGVTQVRTVESRAIDGKTGYIHINYFGKPTADEFASALAAFNENNVTRLVLDLRNCPGGSENAALRVAGWLAPGKPFAQLVTARNRRQSVVAPRPEKGTPNEAKARAVTNAIAKPIVVLVNAGTSGAAENLAAALREQGVGILVGERTYGDGLQHTMFVLNDGSAVTFTTGKFLTPKGMDFQEKGLAVEAPAASPTGAEDTQLEAGLKTLRAKVGAKAR